MKAPDVIYLAESDKVKGEVSSNYASENPFKTHTSIAYIRKDALLEWLEHAKTVYNIRGANVFELLTLQMITEYINSM